MIHVYAFAADVDELPELEGVDGAPVERLLVDEVTTVFSRRTESSGDERLREDALAHGAVVDALMDAASVVIPVRFGEALPDAAELGETVRGRLPELRRSFERVRGCVELGVRVWGADEESDDSAGAATGTAYMRRRAAVEAERRDAAEGLHRQLDAIARAAVVGAPAPFGRERFSAAYLVSSERLEDVRAAVERFGAEHADLTVLCTGPWAPYSFGEEEPPA